MKTRFERLPDGVQAFIVLGSLFATILLLSIPYHRYPSVFVGLWIATPIVSYIIAHGRYLDDMLTEKGMKYVKGWSIGAFVLLSFCFLTDTHLHHRFARHFSGRVWVAEEGDTNDYGEEVATTEYDAPKLWQRLVIGWGYPCGIIAWAFVGSFTMHLGYLPSQREKEKARYQAEWERNQKRYAEEDTGT